MKLNGHIRGFERYLRTSTRLAERTRACYLYEVKRFIAAVGNPETTGLTDDKLLGWHSKLHDAGLAYSTVVQQRAALKRFLLYLAKFGGFRGARQLMETLSVDLEVAADKTPRREPYALDEKAVRKIIQAAGARLGVGVRNRALVHFLWATGIRRSEACATELKNLDMEHMEAHLVGKGDKWRYVYFDRACAMDLDAWLAVRREWHGAGAAPWLFLSAAGQALAPYTVGEIVKESARAAGLKKDVWTHILRHSRLSFLANKGMPIQSVQELAGHARLETTRHYVHVDREIARRDYDRATG